MDAETLRRNAWRATPATTALELAGNRRLPDGSEQPRWLPARHLVWLGGIVADRLHKGDARLIVSIPPRHGKSRILSRWTPIWFLDRWPDRRIALVTYGAKFASRWGRLVRNTAKTHAHRLRFKISEDSQAKDSWETTAGGGMFTAGVGGELTGKDVDLLIVDDPIKNAKEARSEVVKSAHWDWWEQVADTRLEPGTSVILFMTRWAEDDLAGRLEKEGGWEVIRLPALAEEDDALGRKPGEALWPERWTQEILEARRLKRSAAVWAALWQQRPSPQEGGTFKKAWFRYWKQDGLHAVLLDTGGRVVLRTCSKFVTTDLAAAVTDKADYMGVFVWAVAGPRLLLIDRDRARIEGPDLVPAILKMCVKWKASPAYLESTGMQLAIVQQAKRAGVPVRALHRDTSKEARAMAATPAFSAGQIYFPVEAPWLSEYEAELLVFPNGAHDDQVDCTADAVNVFQEKLQGVMSLPTTPEEDDLPARYDAGVTSLR